MLRASKPLLPRQILQDRKTLLKKAKRQSMERPDCPFEIHAALQLV